MSRAAAWTNPEMGAGRPQGGSGRFLGFPLEGFGFLTSLLLALSSGFLAFWVATGAAIFTLLVWNQMLHHHVNYADSYLFVGFPVAIAVWAIALVLFGSLWVRAKIRAR